MTTVVDPVVTVACLNCGTTAQVLASRADALLARWQRDHDRRDNPRDFPAAASGRLAAPISVPEVAA